MWKIEWKKWHLDRIFFWCLGYSLSVSFHRGVWDNGVDIASRCGAPTPVGVRNFLFAPVQTAPGDHPALCAIGTGVSFRRRERPGRGVDHPSPSSANFTRDTDKSLARPGRNQATATKLGIYSTYSPRSSIHFLVRCSNFCKPPKKKSSFWRWHTIVNVPLIFLSEWREFPSAPCLAEKKTW